jgi:hypothetical protein
VTSEVVLLVAVVEVATEMSEVAVMEWTTEVVFVCVVLIVDRMVEVAIIFVLYTVSLCNSIVGVFEDLTSCLR